MRRGERGFGLVVALLLAAILLVAVIGGLHMGVKRLDAERTEATRRMLPQAFRGFFPYTVDQPSGATGANLNTDFKYVPDVPTGFQRTGDATRSWDLRALVDRTQVGISDASFATPPPAFTGSEAPGTTWNGPYWRGAVDGFNRPVDAWGRFLELRYVTSPSVGWIVHSAGANAKDDTVANSGTPSGDDLVFPMPPYTLPVTSEATYPVMLNVSFVAMRTPACGWADSPNQFFTATLTYLDATQTQTEVIAPAGTKINRKSHGAANRFDVLDHAIQLRSSPAGTGGEIQITVTGGCRDYNISPFDFQPNSSSFLTYLGYSTALDVTTYRFRVNYNAAGVTPWPITIQP